MLMRFLFSPVGKILFGFMPFVVYLAHAFLTDVWIVDDAGITYAYAKNLAYGNGITAQPGAAPIEGYSNPFWMLVLSGAHLLGLFHVVFTPKVLSALCFAGTVFFVRKSFLLRGLPEWNATGVLLLFAVNTPLVIWANSGLENGLYLFLLSVLLYRFISAPNILLDVGISFLLMITRPEAVVWGLLFLPSYLVINADGRTVKKQLFYFLFFWLCCILLITLFRVLYFGDFLPNPFFAKVTGEAITWSHILEKAKYLSFSIGGFWASYFIVLCLVLFLFRPRLRNHRHTRMLFLAVLFSFLLFMVMPDDWMRELRFATPFVFFFILFFWEVLIGVFRLRFGLFSLSLFGLFFLYQAHHFYLRTQEFMKAPTVPLSCIKSEFADPYNRLAEMPGLENARVLLPDVGAMYYYGRLSVMDAAGLTDKEIALRLNNNHALRDWILQEKQPEFIHLHGRWSLLYNLPDDTRFKERYVSIIEYPDSLFYEGKMRYFPSGDYVHVSVAQLIGAESLREAMRR
jgi:hypothetical protein